MEAKLVEAITVAIRSVSKRTQTMVIAPDSSMVDDLALDSLDLVSVLMKLEDEYDVKIELDDVPNIQTVGDLAAHLAKIIGDQSVAA